MKDESSEDESNVRCPICGGTRGCDHVLLFFDVMFNASRTASSIPMSSPGSSPGPSSRLSRRAREAVQPIRKLLRAGELGEESRGGLRKVQEAA